MPFKAHAKVFALTLVAGGAIAGASPAPSHNHQHIHAVRRSAIYTTVEVPGPTVPAYAYVLDGKIVSKNEVCEGIEDGSLQLKSPNDIAPECSSSGAGSTEEPAETSMGAEVAPPQPSVTVQLKQEIKAIQTQSSQVPESSMVTPPQPSVTVQQKQEINAIQTQSSQVPESSMVTPPQSSVTVQQKQEINAIQTQSSQVPESSMATPPQSSVTVQQKQGIKATPTQSSQVSESSMEQDSSKPLQSSTATSESLTLTTSSDSAPSVSFSATEPSSTETPLQSGTISEGQGLELEFPDGEIDCSTFPSEYGPIEIEWANLGGWSGIQYVTVEGDAATDIVTAVPGGKGCIPGAMCSYACPPGYQKSQWPSTQGATGQSVGGIQCNANGKLSLTNPDLSKTLCIKGTGATQVQNKLSSNAAICRTDYPGTENEVVPLNTQPDSTSPLTCPDAKNYFTWDGLPTSAQYYINNQGIAVQNACMWGTDGSDMGNWAPSFLGVGQDVYGKTWLSISSTAQNNPSSYSPLNYTVTIQGDISGNCRVSNGRYCSGDNYDHCNEQGCTVELMSGHGTYILSD